MCNGDGLGANYVAAGKNLNVYGTLLAVGDKHTCINGTEGAVGERPDCICGHIHSITVGIDSLCTEVIHGAGSENIIAGLYVYVVKHSGGSNVGDNEDTVSSRTLCTVTGNGTHSEVLFANTLGDKGGGSTAITVSSPHTAESEHSLTLLVITEADGVVCTTTVIHTEDESTVCLDTNHGAGSRITGTFFSLCNQFSVLNHHVEGYAYCMEELTLFKISIKLSTVERLYFTGNISLSISKNVENRRCRAGLSLYAQILTVINKDTGSVSVVVKVGVHTAYNVVSEIVLVILCHLGKFLMSPVRLIVRIFSELIDLIISRDNGYVRVRRVYLNYVKNLSTVTGSIVENYLGLNSCTGYKHVIFLGDYVVIAVSTECCLVVNYVFIFPVRDGCKRGHRESTEDHYDTNDHGYYTILEFNHVFSFLSFFISQRLLAVKKSVIIYQRICALLFCFLLWIVPERNVWENV